MVTAMRGSFSTRISVACTFAAVSLGIRRHWIVALARWGRAFSACPPEIRVATQVVRSSAFPRAVRESRAAAAGSGTGPATASMSALPGPGSRAAKALKLARVVSVRITGKS
jgi:hypothetical protein